MMAVKRPMAVLLTAGLAVLSSVSLSSAQGSTGADSPMYKGGPGRTGEMAGDPIVSQPSTLWQVDLKGPAISSPAVVDGVVYASAGDRHVIAVAADSGRLLWQTTTKAPVRSSPAVADGLVFVNDEGGAISALDATTGSVRWSADAGVASESMPLVLDGTVYIGAQAGDLLALDAGSGERRWAFPTGDELTHSPSSDGSRLFIGSADGTLYGIDIADSKAVWRFPGRAARWATAAVRDGLLFTVGHELADGGDALFAIDAATGAERWRVPSDTPLWAPSVGPGTVYDADADGILRAFDAATGALRWSAAIGGYMRPAPAVVGPALYVFGGANEALGIDAATGRVLWRVPLDGSVEYGTTAAGGRMFAVTTAGSLYAIGPSALAVATVAPSSPGPSAPRGVTASLVTDLHGAPDGLAVPTGLDADPQGRIWVAEGSRNDFAIFGADGAYLERWGEAGSGPGQFDFDNANSGNPTADIVFAPDGSFYVADTGNFRIQQFDAERRFVRAWGGFGTARGQFSIPYALDLDADGNVYVTSGNGTIEVFTSDGTYVRTIGEPGSGDGQLANAGLAISGDHLLVADWDNHRIAVFDLAGRFLANWATGEIGDPNAIDDSPDGTVYVAAGGAVQVLDGSGSLLGSFPTAEGGPSFVVALGDGRVAMTAWHRDPPGASELGFIYKVSRP